MIIDFSKIEKNSITFQCEVSSFKDLKRFFAKIVLFDKQEGLSAFKAYVSEKEQQIILVRNPQSLDNWKKDVFSLLEDNNIIIKDKIENGAATPEEPLLAKKNR